MDPEEKEMEEEEMMEEEEWRSGKRFDRRVTGTTITQFCKFHAVGRCQRGKTCTCAHCEDDIGREWRPRGKGSEVLYKMRLCTRVLAGGRGKNATCYPPPTGIGIVVERAQGYFVFVVGLYVTPEMAPR